MANGIQSGGPPKVSTQRVLLLAIGVVVVLVLLVAGAAVLRGRLTGSRQEREIRRIQALVADVQFAAGSLKSALVRDRAAAVPTSEVLKTFQVEAVGQGVMEPVVAGPAELVVVGTNALALDGIRLSGVSWSAARPLAFINGKVYAVGDVVTGLVVVAITPDSVTVSNRAGVGTLLLYGKTGQVTGQGEKR